MFLSFSGEPIIADVGLGRIIKEVDELRTTIAGTPLYFPPEINAKRPYTIECDIWSLGLILYAIFANDIPNKNVQNYSQLNTWCKNPQIPKLPGHVDPQLKDLISCMLTPEKNRISITEVISHPLFKDLHTNSSGFSQK